MSQPSRKEKGERTKKDKRKKDEEGQRRAALEDSLEDLAQLFSSTFAFAFTQLFIYALDSMNRSKR